MAKPAAKRPDQIVLEKHDGRRLRADASRRKIIEAMMALAREGEMAPSADLVAERADVGRRTVFRLFNDMDSLYAEMQSVMLERIRPILETPLEGPNWRARLEKLVERRVRLFEEIMPVKAAADSQRYRSAFLRAEHDDMTRMLREMLLFVLPKSIVDDSPRFEAFDVTLSFETWLRLRKEQKLSAKAAGMVVRRIIAALAR